MNTSVLDFEEEKTPNCQYSYLELVNEASKNSIEIDEFTEQLVIKRNIKS